METTKKTIIDNIIDRSQNNLNLTAFESLGGSSINYKQFYDLIDVYAKGFLEMGVQNGDVVSICSTGTLDTLLVFAGLNKIGAVAQFVNPTYVKANAKKFIDETNTKLLYCTDRFYPVIKDSLANTGLNKIIVASMSEYSSWLYKVIIKRQKINDADKIPGVDYITLPEFLKNGENSRIKLERIPYEKDKAAVITYTSGTTGEPKGVVHSNDSINNMISIYAMTNGFGPSRGDRNLVLIPPMYLTSFVHSLFGTMIIGLDNILQPIYNPETLGKDLKKYEPTTTVASKSHYINLSKTNLPKGSLSFLQYPYCGGEAFSKKTVEKLNEILAYYGIPPMILGYGQTEFGTMTMFNSDIPYRTNESGILIPTINAKIVDIQTGEPVEKGQRGELYIQTPAIMKEYLHNPTATENFFTVDENGEKWAKTGDVAQIVDNYNGQDVYEVSGRKNDSFITSNGEVVYLFDIEKFIEDFDEVREAEVVAMEIDNEVKPVAHIIFESDNEYDNLETLKNIDSKLKEHYAGTEYIPLIYKMRKSFSTSPISGKRDYNILKTETDGFVKFEDGLFVPVAIDKDVKRLVRKK